MCLYCRRSYGIMGHNVVCMLYLLIYWSKRNSLFLSHLCKENEKKFLLLAKTIIFLFSSCLFHLFRCVLKNCCGEPLSILLKMRHKHVELPFFLTNRFIEILIYMCQANPKKQVILKDNVAGQHQYFT